MSRKASPVKAKAVAADPAMDSASTSVRLAMLGKLHLRRVLSNADGRERVSVSVGDTQSPPAFPVSSSSGSSAVALPQATLTATVIPKAAAVAKAKKRAPKSHNRCVCVCMNVCECVHECVCVCVYMNVCA
jgi:hypothetical protein